MSLTMILGSFIAGATSEGGGAIAFPVMTLLFNIKPQMARDFSLMIQSVGMLAAGVAIYSFNIRIEKRVILPCSIGGALGVFLGLVFLNGVFPAPYVKMFFTSFWLSFCAVLFWKARIKEEWQVILPNNIVLGCLGIMGGLFSSILGTGLDIIVFSYLILVAGSNAKVATPTSVILMGISSLFGFFVRYFFVEQPIPGQVWNYWLVCIPVVVIGAPLGALFISDKSKSFIEKLLMSSIVIQYISSLVIIEQSPKLLVFSAVITLFGLAVFLFFRKWGEKLHR